MEIKFGDIRVGKKFIFKNDKIFCVKNISRDYRGNFICSLWNVSDNRQSRQNYPVKYFMKTGLWKKCGFNPINKIIKHRFLVEC